jgi:hypothetical protein
MTATPPPKRMMTPPVIESDPWLSSWLQAHFEPTDVNYSIPQTDIYNLYLKTCPMAKKVPDPRVLAVVLR